LRPIDVNVVQLDALRAQRGWVGGSVVAPDLTPLEEIERRVQARAKEIQDGPNAASAQTAPYGT